MPSKQKSLSIMWSAFMMLCYGTLVLSYCITTIVTHSFLTAALAAVWAFLGWRYFDEFCRKHLCKIGAVQDRMVSMESKEPVIFEVTVDGVGSVYKGTDGDDASDAYVGYTSDPDYADANICMFEDGELIDERLADETDFDVGECTCEDLPTDGSHDLICPLFEQEG